MNITVGTQVAFPHDVFAPLGRVVSIDGMMATLDVQQCGQPLRMMVTALREHRHGRGCGC